MELVVSEHIVDALFPVDPILDDGGQLVAGFAVDQLVGQGHGDEEHQLVS